MKLWDELWGCMDEKRKWLKSIELLASDEVFDFVKLADDGAVFFIFLVQNFRVLEMVYKVV